MTATSFTIPDHLKWDEHGLVPAIVQDAVSKEVLMLAYMNKTSLQRTIETGETWFWSRSRQELWHKGATSGHTQRVKQLHFDCDNDTILVLVDPQGPACHTGQYSCFDQQMGEQDKQPTGDVHTILSTLESIIAKREAERPEGAYTTYLFEQGRDKILKKVGEETAEVIIAAKNEDNDELRCEASDLIYHLMVLLRERGLPLRDVLSELVKRHTITKASQ